MGITRKFGRRSIDLLMLGSGQAVSMGASLLRNKVLAIYCGVGGIGMFSALSTLLDLIATIAKIGVAESAVREIAKSQSTERKEAMDRTAAALLCFALAMAMLSSGITYFAAQKLAKAALSLDISDGWVLPLSLAVACMVYLSIQMSIIQGTQNFTKLTKITVMGALLSSAICSMLYLSLGVDGIPWGIAAIPASAILSNALLSILSQNGSSVILPTFGEFIDTVGSAIKLGSSLMYSALIAVIAAFTIRAIMIDKSGVADVGLYQASWALASIVSGIVLTTMANEFYPRLARLAQSKVEMSGAVNEQIVFGLILSLPVAIILMASAEFALSTLYSSEFVIARNAFLPIIGGVVVQVATFPMGYIQRATSSSKWIAISQTHFNVLHVVLVWWASTLGKGVGDIGAAFLFATLIHGCFTFFIARRIIGFGLERRTTVVCLLSVALLILSFAINIFVSGNTRLVLGLLALSGSMLFSLKIGRALGAH